MAESNITIPEAIGIAVHHHNAGRFPEAEAIYRQILQKAPDHPFVLHNLGDLFNRMKRYDLAEGYLTRALASNPDDAVFRNTLAVVLLNQGKGPEAFAHCLRACELDPNFPLPWVNLGICYADRIELKKSIAAFRRALELEPENANGHDGLGLSLLMDGQLQEGWMEQEWRWRKPGYEKRRFADAPQWHGEDLTGKRILLVFEQGIGDMLQFCRYVPLLAARGAKVLLEMVVEIQDLMHSVEGVSQYVIAGQPPPPFDYASPLMSVPMWYGTTEHTIPAKVPYLFAAPSRVAQWEPYFKADPTFKIAIAWAGRPTHPNDSNRSTMLSSFAPLAEVPNITFYSLQMGNHAFQGFDPPEGMNVINLGSQLDSFDTTAAILQHMDLVISVDTSIVHLAGAMGKPVWNLLAMCPDWRWMLNRNDTPWYPTMRLFRCPTRRDWPTLMAQVKECLAEATLRKRRGLDNWAMLPGKP